MGGKVDIFFAYVTAEYIRIRFPGTGDSPGTSRRCRRCGCEGCCGARRMRQAGISAFEYPARAWRDAATLDQLPQWRHWSICQAEGCAEIVLAQPDFFEPDGGPDGGFFALHRGSCQEARDRPGKSKIGKRRVCRVVRSDSAYGRNV